MNFLAPALPRSLKPMARLGLLILVLFGPTVSPLASGQKNAISTLDLLKQPGWQYHSTHVTVVDGGYRVAQSEAANKYGWAELPLHVDLKRYPLLRVEVEGANPRAQWTLKIQFPPRQEEWLITDTDQNGVFNFPAGEYLDRYLQGEAIVRFFVMGSVGASVTLKRLEFVEAGESARERITIHEEKPLQSIEGARGQLDYPLWTVGKQFDHVSSAEIHALVGQLKRNGVSVARVGAYGDVIQAATQNPDDPRLQCLVHHLQLLQKEGIKTTFVAWLVPPETAKLKPKSDAWRESCVRLYAGFLEYCAAYNAPVSFFELQNEPHAHLQWWNPDFLAQCGLDLAKACEQRKLSTDVIGPDGIGQVWVDAWAKGMGTRGRIIALKTGADKRGTREMTGHQVAAVISRCQEANPGTRRYWLTEYGCWAWGDPDVDRRGEGGPCDGVRYGTAMAELTHYYLQAGIACPSIWELLDVRRIDEVDGHNPPLPPKRAGMFAYKTEKWRKRAHFATLGHYDRALEAGSRLFASESDGGLLPTAVRTQDGWRVVVFNRFGFPKSAALKLPGGDWGEEVAWTLTDPRNLTETRAVSVHNGEVSLALPSYGIGTLTLRNKPQAVKAETLVFADPEVPRPVKGKALLTETFDAQAPERWRSPDAGVSLTALITPEHTLAAGKDVTLWSKQSFPVEKILELRVRFSQGNGEVCPVPWAAPDEGRFLQAQILPGRCILHRFDHGFHELPNSVPLTMKPGEWHLFTVRQTKQRLKVWQDGVFLLDYEGDDLPQIPGQVGLRGHGMEIKELNVYETAP
ncbi:MAG: hypothetical protein JWL77_1023 [Chthonomonadaceae bacterium]|nr:hypothetical protein [Chthonomonadaceae bacterium]